MIRYQLTCKKEHSFEGWFRDSAAYDAQAKKKLVSCPVCGSTKVAKAPMAPAVSKKAELTEAAQKAKAVKEFVLNLRKQVEENAEYVGDRFPNEARAIHYGDAEERQIYGEATIKDAQDLIEEGIPVAPLPSIPRADS
jgi:hypothetical protein